MSAEAKASQVAHEQGLPLLISPRFLRRRGAGQVDLAYYREGKIFLVEVKSSLRLSWKQRHRLQRSAALMSAIFDRSSLLRLWVWGRNGLYTYAI